MGVGAVLTAHCKRGRCEEVGVQTVVPLWQCTVLMGWFLFFWCYHLRIRGVNSQRWRSTSLCDSFGIPAYTTWKTVTYCKHQLFEYVEGSLLCSNIQPTALTSLSAYVTVSLTWTEWGGKSMSQSEACISTLWSKNRYIAERNAYIMC